MFMAIRLGVRVRESSFTFHMVLAECPHYAFQIIIENETCLSHAAVNYNVRLAPQFSGIAAAISSLNDFCEVHASNHGHAVRPLAAYARTVRARAMSASLCPGLTTSGSTKGPDGGSTTALTDSHSEGAKRDRFRTNSFLNQWATNLVRIGEICSLRLS